jgi:hypothetical protein
VDFVEGLVGVRGRRKLRPRLRVPGLVWQLRHCVDGIATRVTMLFGEFGRLVLRTAARKSGMAVRGIRRCGDNCRWKLWPARQML